MLLLVSQLIGRAVVSLDSANYLGVLASPIIDPDNGKLVGYFFSHGPFNLRSSVLSTVDIAGYDKERLVVHGAEVGRELQEEPKIKKIVERKIPVYGARVITESGTHLGRATDLLVDTELDMVVKYYVHGLVRERVIAANQVNRIEKRGIIVDDTTTGSATATAEASEA